MKIAILTSGGVDRSGVERVIPCLLWLIERLVKAGDEVHVFALSQEDQPGTWGLNGATIHNAGRRRSGRTMFAQLMAEHRRGPFQIIHSSWSVVAHMIAVLAGRILGVPSLVYLCNRELAHFPDIATPQSSRLGRMMVRFALDQATRVAASSDPTVEQARRVGVAATRLPFGIALDHWPPSPPRRRDPGRPARLLHVGAIVPIKDHELLLQTLEGLKAMGADFQIDIVGEDVSGEDWVRRRVDALGLGDRVRFPGFVPHHELRALFLEADLQLVTSRHEGAPLVVLEAAVAGVPTVGTRVGHLAEWAPDAARIVDPRDAQGLVQAVIEILADEDARIALARQAQQRALAEDADATSRRFRALYADLDSARRQAGLWPKPSPRPATPTACQL